MAFLVLTRNGFESLIATLGKVPPNLWVGQNVLSDQELARYRENGFDITNFTIDIPLGDRSAINIALDTIADHHPDEPVFAKWTDC